MDDLRIQGCLGSPEILDVRAPFSNFDFVESRFGKNRPLKRILSQARMANFLTLVIEKIDSRGFSKDDDDDLKEAGFELSLKNLIRLSFFKKIFAGVSDIKNNLDEGYLGYAILKEVPFGNKFRWIIFESITRPARHDNNYYHAEKEYKVCCVDKIFKIKGNIYCQQNGSTNVCAHAALRTCLSMTESFNDFSYRQMNKILKENGLPHGLKEPLSDDQIKLILNKSGINYSLQAYPLADNQPKIPFQKYLYGSIESGQPALLGFESGNSGHIIPVIGHTFNEDTWVPNADTSYFSIGQDTRYVPSESWVSSYICHDDNFGSHFCLPRQYLSSKDKILVIGFLPKQTKYDAIAAEAIAIDYLYLITLNLQPNSDHVWLKRLREAVMIEKGWVVLRTIFISGNKYVEHLENLQGWRTGEHIDAQITGKLRELLKGSYWMVEISLPELFPANRRKLGEIILNAEAPITPDTISASYMFARLPGGLYVLGEKEDGKPFVSNYPLAIHTHSQIYSKS